MMSTEASHRNNLFFLAVSKNKATVYEYDVSFSSCIINDIEKEIKRSEEDVGAFSQSGNRECVIGETAKRECADVKETIRSNGTVPRTEGKKTGKKFNNDFVVNRGIRIYKEFDDVELATCTNDYKKIILVRKADLNVAEVIDLQGGTNRPPFQIRAKTPIKAINSSPKDSHLVLYCQYKPQVSPHNLFLYRIGQAAAKKKNRNKQNKQTNQSNQPNQPNKKDKNGDRVGKGNQRADDGEAPKEEKSSTTPKGIPKGGTKTSGQGDKTEEDSHHGYGGSGQRDNLDELPVRVDTLKSYSSKMWPFYKWSQSESICAIRINNDIYVYRENNFTSYVSRLSLENLEFFDVSPEQSNKKGVLLATYERGGKGQPSVFKIFNSSDWKNHVYTKTFFNSDEMKLKWNKNASAVLLNVHTQVDKEKQYYYGLSNLFFIDTDKFTEVNIMTDRGQIYDCIWSYNQNKFYVCKGDIPAEIVLYDKSANIAHSFGRHKFNTLKLNCSEKLLLTGGFGNLSGDITLWNTSTKKEVTRTKASCAVICEFFNDGKHFVTATTHPRLRVDNHLKIFTHDGFIVSRINFEELYQVIILPFNKIPFSESDASLGVFMENSSQQIYIHKQLGIDSKKTGVYRAPGTSAIASLTLNGFMNAKKPTQKPGNQKPPGANFVQEQKKKAPQKKKKKKKKNPQTGEAEGDVEEDEP
ncbi:hypothetical protein C922_03147 [Plasmodium inui San Antonio 1]|uniref:Translation initiation factor beta propellor-like domain-containing protein n=1 Tax=Plasmodium inui San Antonio 1 TaxID=1237626 RepID=W7A5M8_9APIC|nr:hypothetical protein C922_03147 [Plasmodium inui San Antonio 1]EUD66513.1 hypothetical protein C922_03147 [Plasmodium inui San Antonio 1]